MLSDSAPIAALSAPQSVGDALDILRELLSQGAQLEHLLALNYLYAAFSLKKYSGEFSQSPTPEQTERIEAQLERNRRWEAQILFVARQEMEHLCMVQNMLAILDEPPYMWRPNFPIAPDRYPIGPALTLSRFSRTTIETFRYFEKPLDVHLPLPPTPAELTGLPPGDTASLYNSVEKLYQDIRMLFDYLLQHRYVQGRNPNRVVNEHFGFNIELDPLVIGKYESYLDQIISLIIDQGEGAGSVPPTLGSHFMTFQQILADLTTCEQAGMPGDPALPVVENPVLQTQFHTIGSNGQPTGYLVTNSFTRKAVQLFNEAYTLQNRMLTGFFALYNVDNTTGVHPPRVNAYFQTAFYPFMTMIIRPLSETLCRLPADASYQPQPGKLPERTAGPSFELLVPQGKNGDAEQRATFAPFDDLAQYEAAFESLRKQAEWLAQNVPPGYAPLGGRSHRENFVLLEQNLWRIRQNFARYWTGEIVAPIPSKDFTNFDGPQPFN